MAKISGYHFLYKYFTYHTHKIAGGLTPYLFITTLLEQQFGGSSVVHKSVAR